MKNILVFGSNGLLTTNLRSRFKNKHNIKYAGSKNYDYKYNYLHKNLDHIIENNNFDIILNCLGYTNIDYCEKNKDIAFKLNCEFPKLLINTINKYKKKTKIIHISTDHFYNENKLSDENDIQILNYYSKTKFEGEKILMGNNTLILRTNFIGKSHHLNKKSLTDWFFYNLVNDISFDAFSDIYFSPLSFNSLTLIIQEIFNDFEYGVYNLGSVGKISKFELANNLAILMKKEHLINKRTSDNFFEVKRAKNMSMNCNQFSKVFKYSLPTIKEEIQNTYNEYLTTNTF